MVLNHCLFEKLIINKLGMLFLVPFLMNFLMFIVNIKLQKKFRMR